MLGDLMTDVVALALEPAARGSDAAASVRVTGGGSAANVAAWAAFLGGDVDFVGRVGDDAFGRQAIADLTAAGARVHVAVDPVRPTGTCVVVVTPDGERTMFPDAGANATWSRDDVPVDAIAGAAHLHLVGYALLRDGARDAALVARDLARDNGPTWSVDPSSAAPLAAVGAAAFLDWTAGADLCFANIDEATVLTGLDDPHAAARALTQTYAAVVVKLGPRGAIWAGRDTDPVVVPANVVEVVDSTGAGDAFAAAYLVSTLRGDPPEAALEAATSAAALAVQRLGARPFVPPTHAE